MPQNTLVLDQDAVDKFSEKVWNTIQSTMMMATCFLGDQLGLYRALAQIGIK
jgi:hypothetical protein